MTPYAFPIARPCLAAVFLYSGVDKLCHWRSSIEEVKSDGLPWPAAFAGATVFTQLVGGCLVATGLFAWLGALVLAGFRLRPRCSGTASGSASKAGKVRRPAPTKSHRSSSSAHPLSRAEWLPRRSATWGLRRPSARNRQKTRR
jgi:hypothetical protein